MPRHEPCVSWASKKIGVYPNTMIKTLENNMIQIQFFPEKDRDGIAFNLDRRHARLLAKRINQCLDETK